MKNKTKNYLLIGIPLYFFWLAFGIKFNFCFDFWFMTLISIAIISLSLGLTNLIMESEYGN